MNPGFSEALILAGQAEKVAERVKHIDIVICPPFPFIYPIFDSLKARPKNFTLGIQNVMWAHEGEFTGEVSLDMFRGVAKYFIIGHSERRQNFSESDIMISKKVKFVLANRLKVIVCVGERERLDLEDDFNRELKKMRGEGGILDQVDKAFVKVDKSFLANAVVAYEPLWAIGTGNASSGAYAAAVCYAIREHLKQKFGEVAQETRIIYGGSVYPSNVREFMTQPSIDGLLVGGSSLKAAEFSKICQISVEVKSGRSI